MNISFTSILLFFYILIIVTFILILYIIISKLVNNYKLKKSKKMTDFLLNIFPTNTSLHSNNFINKNVKLFLEKYIELNQNFLVSSADRDKAIAYLHSNKIFKAYLQRLNSTSKFKKIKASTYLSYIPCEESRINLEKALLSEKDFVVKQYICNSLCDLGDSRSIDAMVKTLKGSPNWYQQRISVFLSEFGESFYNYIPSILESSDYEIQKLIIYFSSIYISDTLKNHLITLGDSDNKNLAYEALEVVATLYYEELNMDKYLKNNDLNIVNIAIKSLSRINTKETVDKLIYFLDDAILAKNAIYSISTILRNESSLLLYIMDKFYSEENTKIKQGLAEVLSTKVEYFLLKFLSNERTRVRTLIKEIILLGRINGIIGFLNNNKNIEIENEILSVISEVIDTNEDLKTEFSFYLNESILNKLNLEKAQPKKPEKDPKKEKVKLILLYSLLSFITIIFPVVYVLRHHSAMFKLSLLDQIKLYIIDFNYYLIYYATSINTVSIIIILFSFIGLYKQSKYWNIKKMSFLFKKKVLPRISIIAPAYCEENTIIESVNSLLNLQYPDYELIVVNDGSIDDTLNKLIDYYKLEKVDSIIISKLKTMPIRGIYINKQIPKLVVVDKANGGKADTINAGINMSRKDYFCCIDADSLLEPEALLKIASVGIDDDAETLAVGGNVFPINGCKIDMGTLSEINISRNIIAKFQTIEYLRAFMTGRIGWAYINSLLIISGAFGLFNKERVIEIGGYLTSSERYKKDTVGEDMEIVVRLTRHMHEQGLNGKVYYSYNANCWTEVPENLSVLHRQRDRWQRGLIDIITFHRKILFNPKYKQMGLISFPYFFIFEMIGPILEIQGYIMVIFATILGILNTKVALLLFISNVLLGVVVSLSSIIISEKDSNYYKLSEILNLILFALIENFGFKQLMCTWKSYGYISSMKKSKGWGTMTRKGFSKK